MEHNKITRNQLALDFLKALLSADPFDLPFELRIQSAFDYADAFLKEAAQRPYKQE